jgi:uncharacterized protein (UPF0262 family)
MSAFASVSLAPEILDSVSDRLRADCITIISEIARDAAVVLFDGPPPYDLHIQMTESAMLLHFTGLHLSRPASLPLHISVLRSLMHDYDLMIGAHGSALRHQLSHSRSEAIDMGRRAMHNEGAELILQELAPHLTADLGTARLIFTLMFLLTQRR